MSLFQSLIGSSFIQAPAPNYASLSNIELILDSTGLVSNTDNSYGTVDSSGYVTTWKSLTPGPTGRNFPAVGNLESLRLGLYGEIHFDGSARFRHGTLATWNFMHYNATIGNLKWTVHAVVRFGFNYNNWVGPILGNNQGSQSSKGASIALDDRITLPRTNAVANTISKGSAGLIVGAEANNLFIPNTWHIVTVETDMSLAAGSRQRVLIDGVLTALTVSSPSTAVVTTPSFDLEIGGFGNGILPLFGAMSHVIIQSRVETSGVRDAFIATLLPHRNKPVAPISIVNQSRTYNVYNTLANAGRYYFVQGLLQSPTSPDTIIKLFHDGNEHVWNADKKVAFQKSTTKGRIWPVQSDAVDYDAGGPFGVQDSEWCWGSDGRIHGISDWHTALAPAASHRLLYTYSDDELGTTTTIDITSVLPADGLIAYRGHGVIVEPGDGYLYACLYKFTDEADFTQSANYVLRKPVGSSTTWTPFTVRAIGSASINEMALVALDSTTLLALIRDETTKEWRQYIGTSNGTSWTDQGAITFGESMTTVAQPPLLSKFKIGATDVIAAWILNKESATKTFKVVYGTASAIKTLGLSGWTVGTKTTVYSGTAIFHYGRVCHYNNTMNAIGAIALEPIPFTATENSLISFEAPATQYLSVKAALGL